MEEGEEREALFRLRSTRVIEVGVGCHPSVLAVKLVNSLLKIQIYLLFENLYQGVYQTDL